MKEYPEGSFAWAAKMMLEGKKVTNNFHDGNVGYHFTSDGSMPYYLDDDDLGCSGWELFQGEQGCQVKQ